MQLAISRLRRQWHPTPVLLPGISHGWRSLVGWSPWGREELDTTEQLPFHVSLSCIGEGNGNPLQCSCLENPRDGRAWWAAIYGVTQSQTWLKWLSSSSSRSRSHPHLYFTLPWPHSIPLLLLLRQLQNRHHLPQPLPSLYLLNTAFRLTFWKLSLVSLPISWLWNTVPSIRKVHIQNSKAFF